MLVQIEGCPGRMSTMPSIMDSPTLVRVERAMLRHEEGSNRETASFNGTALAQSLVSGNYDMKSNYHAIKRGILWQQRDRLFSRWKERYFVLTRDYLHCFRRASGTDRVSEMGQFLFKIKLVDVEKIEWVNKKTYSTISMELGREGKILLRARDGLEDWFELLEECMLTSKERRKALKYSHECEKRINNNSINSTLEEWLLAQQKLPNIRGLPFESGIGDNGGRGEDIVRKRERNWKSKLEDSSAWSLQDNSDNRLSLLTDIDISSYDSTIDSPLVATHGHNRNTYLSDEKGLSIRRSYRSTTKIVGSDISVDIPKEYIPPYDATPQFIKFRERSHSDIQKIDRQPWKICASIDSTPLYN